MKARPAIVFGRSTSRLRRNARARGCPVDIGLAGAENEIPGAVERHPHLLQVFVTDMPLPTQADDAFGRAQADSRTLRIME